MAGHHATTLAQLGWTPFFQQQLAALDASGLVPARVVEIQRTHVVLVHAGGTLDAPLGGRWFQLDAEARPAVGDWVLVDLADGNVVHCLERASVLKRMGAGATGIQVIAANVDVLFLVTSCNADFNPRRLERYLALALESGVVPVVVLTKADLTDQADDFAARARELRPGLVVELVNALDVETLECLKPWCEPGRTIALLGSSGVGKSTLVNSLSGTRTALTAAIREDDAKGRHTTTTRSLHRLPSGALLLDSPGMRELAIADAEQGVAAMFEDIDALAMSCRFGDCGHTSEPGCAVQQAIADGALDGDRLSSYRKLKREETYNRETVAERHARSRAFGKMTRASQTRKRRD